jgi:hypothetical protein
LRDSSRGEKERNSMVRCFFYSLFRFSLQKNGLVLEKEQEEKGQEGEEGEEEDHQQQALSSDGGGGSGGDAEARRLARASKLVRGREI